MNGAAIAALRKLAGHNGTAFANKIKVHRAYLSNIENGHRKSVSPAVARCIAETLEVPLAAILSGAEVPEDAA